VWSFCVILRRTFVLYVSVCVVYVRIVCLCLGVWYVCLCVGRWVVCVCVGLCVFVTCVFSLWCECLCV